MSQKTTGVADLGGIDTDDIVVHARIPGTPRSYCGRPIGSSDSYLPSEEVTESAWCPVCVAVQDGLGA